MTQIFDRPETTPVEHEYTPIQLKIFRDRYALGEEQFPHEAWQRVASAVAAMELPGRRDYWTQRFF
jgi:hypothetical protein